MARQIGNFKIEGSLGDLCFYKSRYGYLVRRKGSVSKQRIKSDPAFKHVRENNADFKHAALTSKLFRNALRSLIRRAGDATYSNRLMSAMMKVIKSGKVIAAQPTIDDGDLKLMEGFEFNQNSPLSTTFHAPMNAVIDRTKGAMITDIPAFLPTKMLTIPNGATHFRFIFGALAIDFKTDTYNLLTSDTAYLPITPRKTKRLQVVQKIKPGSADRLFLVLGVEFAQAVNGMHEPLKDIGMNALSVVRVEK